MWEKNIEKYGWVNMTLFILILVMFLESDCCCYFSKT